MSALPPDAVASLPGAEAAAVSWRTQGQRYITIIVKASFAFTPGAAMWRTEPQEILRAEVHHGKNPARSVRFTGDLAPYLGRADVLFTGDAHAPDGAHVESLPVRLAVFGASGCALDKRLLVRDKKPFQRMPLVYEKAARGANGLENPFGIDASDGEARVLDPQDPARPAGLGPIARAWPVRKRLLGKTRRETLEGPNAEIPAGFDWSYFQAAPPDQRIDYLRGDEWIVLENLHPAARRLEMRLPRARGMARIHGLGAPPAAGGDVIELNADTLRIDGAEQRCTVVWRQIVPVHDDALAAVRIAAGVAVDGEELAWPDLRPGRASGAASAAPGALPIGPQGTVHIEDTPGAPGPARLRDGDPGRTIHLSDDEVEIIDLIQRPSPLQTVALTDEQGEAAVRAAALPFAAAPGSARQSRPEPARPLIDAVASATLTDEHGETVMRAPALPFTAAPGLARQSRPEPARPLIDAVASATLALSSEEEVRVGERPAIPFFFDPRSAPRLDLRLRAPIVGAPWSGALASPAPGPSMGLATLALEDAPPPSAEVLPPPVEVLPPPVEVLPPPVASSSYAAPASGVLVREPERPAASRFFHVLRREDESPSGPLPPLGDGEEVSLERCAIITAELAEKPVPRADVLKAHGLSEARWAEAERRWRDSMTEEARSRERALRDRFDAAYVGAWEAVCGPLHAADYARLIVATERSGGAAALGERAIRRTVWVRIKRLWARRLAEDPRLRARVEAEIARLREAPRQRAQGGALTAHAV
ncbi:DUF2169 family type VI secretion system accessory protein [Sorangium atrum]|uniref:DUF2169 domain-containing protein n=1 Tax=Sorangium atrum TaxID=2995308 RepID=A0ABT5C3M3_9BACT|nr:DUF2169 domain-containing protein [Sorangium aterium]MDC0681019.1 DUF2169 domain-containing protein [Sorangium aterium]